MLIAVYLSTCAQDFSGMETSGNKIRKLEFLMAEAVVQRADCVVTCGGVQSNHCRATASIARMLGLDSYLLLRTNKPDEDPGLVGNLLFDRWRRWICDDLLLVGRSLTSRAHSTEWSMRRSSKCPAKSTGGTGVKR